MPRFRKAEMPEHFFWRKIPDDRPVRLRGCDHPECGEQGQYRAPRRAELESENPLAPIGGAEREFYWLCLDHVKAFNAKWNFYEGFDEKEMEEAIRSDAQWNRPSWPLGRKAGAKKSRNQTADTPPHKNKKDNQTSSPIRIHQLAELKALAVLELEPPTDFTLIKKRYRLLVKRHHPDVQETTEDKRCAEEKLKAFNSAFTILKTIYEKHD